MDKSSEQDEPTRQKPGAGDVERDCEVAQAASSALTDSIVGDVKPLAGANFQAASKLKAADFFTGSCGAMARSRAMS